MENLGVVNKSWKRVEGIEYINIMRGSVLGNPFKMVDDNPLERKRVIEEYRQYLWKKLNEKDNSPDNNGYQYSAFSNTYCHKR